MPAIPQNYFRYFAVTSEAAIWGFDVTAAGFTRVPKGVAYPLSQHPIDHDFRWERGRVLDALQIIFISGGRGYFETQGMNLCEVQLGDAFVVLPGVWHRYRPHSDYGWEESWIEVQGDLVDRMIAAKIFHPKKAVRRGALQAGMYEALEAVHARSRSGAPGFDVGRTAAAFNVLAAWHLAQQSLKRENRMAKTIHDAEHYLAEHYAEPVNIAQLAKKLGVAYSHFRRAFRAQTGFAPWQYIMHLRLSHAKRLIASSEATLDDIADQLNFNSASHLSLAFKQTFGSSPTLWRQQLYSQDKANSD